MPKTFQIVEDQFTPPAPLPSTTQAGGRQEFTLVEEDFPDPPETDGSQSFEQVVTEFDRHGKEVSLPVYDDAGKRLHRPKYDSTGSMTHNERGVMTYDEWLKKKNEGGDWWQVAKDAVTHLAGGFTKIPGKIKEEGVMEASANIPESFLAAMEGVRMLGGGAGRLLAKPFRTDEEENKAEYEAYADFGDQIFRQLELRKSRMGDVARMFGAKELAEVYDDGIDPEVADSLSLIFDPTYLVGGGLAKVGAAGMRHVPKVTNKYAKQVMAAASKAANTKIGAAGGKALKEVGQRVATPITSFVSGSGKAGEMLGRGIQQASERTAEWAIKNPGKAGTAQAIVGAGTGYSVAPEGQEIPYVLGGAFGGKYALESKRFIGAGETLEKAAQRIGGAAEAAKINSVRVSGLGTVAKTRKMSEDVAKQFIKYDNRVANKLLSGAAKIADTAAVGAGMGAGIGSLMPTDPNYPGWAAGLGIGTFVAPIGLVSAKALSNLARVEISRGGVPSADLRLRIKETPDHQMASEAVVERFAAGLPEEQRVRFVDPDRGLSVHDMATQAEAVNWAMGAKRYAGKDVELFVGNAQEVVAETGNPFHETVAGFWDDQTNKIYINTDAEVSTMTLLHEVFHPTETWSSRQKKLDTELDEVVDVDPLQDLQTDLVQTIVGTYAPDGSQMKAGLYSADELGKLIDQYNSKLYPDQTSNIIAKKAEIAAEFKKSGGADTPDLTLMNRELDELTIKQDDRSTQLAAFDLLPESEKRNFIAREILSEQFAMFGESARHGIIRKARNTVLKKDYFRDKFLGMEIDKLKFHTLGRVRKTLEQVGVKFDLAGNPRGDMTATSVIFKDPKTGRQMVADPGVEHLIAQYIIEKDPLVNRLSETSEVGGSEMTFKASDAAKKNADGTPKVPRAIIERWAESGWVKTDKSGDILNSTGGKWQPGQRPAFTTAKERTRMDKDRVAALVAALEPVTKQIGDEEESVGAVRWRETDGGGKNFSGSYFDDAQMKAIMEAPDDVVQPAFKENIRMMNEAVKTREGQPFLADYWKAITGRGYDSKARMKVQLFTPIGMEISSAGNFNATIFNVGYFENKINRWLGQSGKKKFWKEWADEDGRVDVDAFRRDVNELLGTHFADDPQVKYPDNIKKEKMYSFLGVKPFLPGRKDWNTSVKDRKMIQKFRADRMKNLTPGMGDNFPINYGKARERYMPGEAVRKSAFEETQEESVKRRTESAIEFYSEPGRGEAEFPQSGEKAKRLKTLKDYEEGKHRDRFIESHREAVAHAVNQDWDVPFSVIKDYPELIIIQTTRKLKSDPDYVPDVRYMPGGDVYARPLEVIKERIPASERFIGIKLPGKAVMRPDGKSFMEADLDTPIGKLDFTQDKIDAAFMEAISESGPAGQKAINELATPVTKKNKDGVEEVVRPAFIMRPPDEAHWRDVENLPNRDRLWYEISAEAMDTSFPDHRQKQLGEVMDMTAATSPLADPNYNSRVMISIMSEIARNEPITTPAVVQKSVQDVVTGEFGKAEARKVGSFGQTFKFLRGLVDDPPLSTNDRQVAASFGIPDAAFGRYPVLYEVVARWFNKMRDNANTFRPGDPNGPFQSYQLQAPSWVQTRAEGQLSRSKKLTEAEAFEGDAYASAFGQVADALRAGGIKVGIDPKTGLPLFDNSVLKDPRVTEILMPLAGEFRRDVFGTMEVGTNLNKTGKQFNDLISESRELGIDKNLKLSDDLIRRHMNRLLLREKVGGQKKPSILTELARSFGEKSADVSRIELGWGTFKGDMSRNIRIPLKDVPEQYREAYLAVLGEAYQQEAQAAGRFTDTNNPNPATYSVFLKNMVDADIPELRQFAEDLSASGHEANIQLRPNGLVLDIHPKYTDDGGQVPIGGATIQRLVNTAFPNNATNIRRQDYKSIYIMDFQYGSAIDKWKKVLENEAADDIQSILHSIPKRALDKWKKDLENKNVSPNDIKAITGGSRGEARNLARGNKSAIDRLPRNIIRRVEKVGRERRARLHQLELTRRRLKKSVKAFEKDILDNGIPKLQKRIDSRKAEQASIPKPKNLRPDFGRPDVQFMPATPGRRTPTPLTPEATRFILDRVARFTPPEMDSRKDRAQELLKKFIEQ